MKKKESLEKSESAKKEDKIVTSKSIFEHVQTSILTIKSFFTETVEELKRCSWPNRGELAQSTILVILMTFAVSFFSGLVVWIGGICLLQGPSYISLKISQLFG